MDKDNNEIDFTEFNELIDYTINEIPNEILEIYKRIYRSNSNKYRSTSKIYFKFVITIYTIFVLVHIFPRVAEAVCGICNVRGCDD